MPWCTLAAPSEPLTESMSNRSTRSVASNSRATQYTPTQVLTYRIQAKTRSLMRSTPLKAEQNPSQAARNPRLPVRYYPALQHRRCSASPAAGQQTLTLDL
jgi:hypothetical protein